MAETTVSDLLVLGSGVAGLSAAVRAAAKACRSPSSPRVSSGGRPPRCAQGGVAAVLDPDDDSPDLHGSDTLVAGAGLCDVDAVRVLVERGSDSSPRADRSGRALRPGRWPRRLRSPREGGHSVARVVHAGGDATGAEVERALVAAVQAFGRRHPRGLASPSSSSSRTAASWESTAISPEGPVDGAGSPRPRRDGRRRPAASPSPPTRPSPPATASPWRCGPAPRSPTSSSCSSTPPHCTTRPCPARCSPRRCGARARSCATNAVWRFMADEHPLADLAPRDVVAKAISRRLIERDLDHLWLDATAIDDFPARFPTIWSACRSVGLDPIRRLVAGGACSALPLRWCLHRSRRRDDAARPLGVW